MPYDKRKAILELFFMLLAPLANKDLGPASVSHYPLELPKSLLISSVMWTEGLLDTPLP